MENKKYTCDICNKKYVSENTLSTHKRKFHTNSVEKDASTTNNAPETSRRRLYNCDYCDKTFTVIQFAWVHNIACKEAKKQEKLLQEAQENKEISKEEENNKLIKKHIQYVGNFINYIFFFLLEHVDKENEEEKFDIFRNEISDITTNYIKLINFTENILTFSTEK